MPRLERTALLAHSAEDLYRLVGDFERYPEFLPGCTSALVEARDPSPEGERVRARLGFKVKGISDSFVTENLHVPGQRIDMRLVEGPFRSLSGRWEFRALSEEACKVIFQLQLELGSRMLELTLGPWIERGASGMMDAFVARAARQGRSG